MKFVELEENFDPEVYVRVDLSRYAPGGATTLAGMDGARSTISQFPPAERAGQGGRTAPSERPADGGLPRGGRECADLVGLALDATAGLQGSAYLSVFKHTR